MSEDSHALPFDQNTPTTSPTIGTNGPTETEHTYTLRRQQIPSRRLRHEGAYLTASEAAFKCMHTTARGTIYKRVEGYMSRKTFVDIFDIFEDGEGKEGTRRLLFNEDNDRLAQWLQQTFR